MEHPNSCLDVLASQHSFFILLFCILGSRKRCLIKVEGAKGFREIEEFIGKGIKELYGQGCNQ
jgi:hypothetical protein